MTPYSTPPRSKYCSESSSLHQDTGPLRGTSSQLLPLTPQSIQPSTRQSLQSPNFVLTPSLPPYVNPYGIPTKRSSVEAPKLSEPPPFVKASTHNAITSMETPWGAMIAAFVHNLPAGSPHLPFANVPLFDETTTKVRKLVEKKMFVADKDTDGNTIKVELFYLGLNDIQEHARYLVYNHFDFTFATPTKTYTVDFKIWSRKFPHGSSVLKTPIWNYEIGICGHLRYCSMSDLSKEDQTTTFSCPVFAKSKEEDPSWGDIVSTLGRALETLYHTAPFQPNEEVSVKSPIPRPQKSRGSKPSYLPPPHAPSVTYPVPSLDTYVAAIHREAAMRKRKAEEVLGPASKRLHY
ncbi:hypothetical protein ONS95_001255 [Cadophora gregata]|uniref:uncharacterized protein n=1 Tax=Cadophora gregata TaxID=51156 RepID=UPI0026DB0E3B|nr:uncharacterized protein ONS95_001255 [Cadophora gregata]KAK0101936.1 hypothetical protein ONS96_005906 [Cadophora gregata f. sp. sojae]KAK0129324.1 hypothetical protein ONS95_001255 [Cadophora gregata]